MMGDPEVGPMQSKTSQSVSVEIKGERSGPARFGRIQGMLLLESVA
jgi:hypothetical protein